MRCTSCANLIHLSNGRNGDVISHPSIQGQKEVISLAYKLGNLNPEDTSYIECHGTGTTVGDPIEVNAIHEMMGATRSANNPIRIGSVSVLFPLWFRSRFAPL
jgi:acyl transferase domain-containing protein